MTTKGWDHWGHVGGFSQLVCMTGDTAGASTVNSTLRFKKKRIPFRDYITALQPRRLKQLESSGLFLSFCFDNNRANSLMTFIKNVLK